VVRLHAHPLDWLEAGCTGVCHIEPCSRKALKELHAAKTIQCNDIYTALQAWDWGFDADEAEQGRFEIDDTPESISRYIEDEVNLRVLHRLRMEGLPVGADPKLIRSSPRESKKCGQSTFMPLMLPSWSRTREEA
jgi:Ser-tRNA(Ala) deacylase AlaX